MRRLLLLWGCASTVFAAGPPDPDIVVTSTRIPTPLHAVGGAVTVLDLEEWDGAELSVARILEAQTGIQIGRTGGPGQMTQLRMRGAEANHVLVLLDGVEIGSPASGLDLSHLNTRGIARIEILRGAQSALWGSNAAAGVIHLISKDAADVETTWSLRAGGDQEYESQIDLSAGDDDTGITLHGQIFDTHGDNVAAEGTEEDGSRHRGVHLTARHRVGDHLLRSTLRLDRGHTQYDGFVAGRAADAPYRSRQDRTLAGLSWQTQKERFHVSARAGYLETSDRAEDNFGTTESIGQRLNLEVLGWRDLANCPGTGSCSLGIGVETERARYTRGDVGPLVARSTSVTTFARAAPWQGTSFDVSLRRDYNREFGDADTWRTGISVQIPDSAWRLYAAAGTGIVNPSLIDRFGFFPGRFLGNPGLQPERTRDHEVGIGFGRGGVRARVSWFHQRLVDEIESAFDADAGLFTTRNSTGTSRRRGIEAEAKFPLGDSWEADLRYTFTRATEPGADGKVREVRRPRHQYGTTLRYQDGADRITLHTDAVRSLIDLDFVQFPAPRVTLDNYTVSHFTWRRTFSADLEAVLSVHNLFNESYEEVLGYRASDRHISLELRVRR